MNLPQITLLNPDCQNWVRDALSEHDFDSNRLVLELLETRVMEKDGYMEAIGGLQGFGVKLAICDLGSGYSSLLRFSTLPFDL